MPIRPLALAIASLLAVLAVPAVHAQDDATDLDHIVVTATRTPLSVDETLAAVEVITREDIERAQPHSLPDLLRGRAGISLSNQGGAGKLTTLFMRGAESDHVLVLVDGVRVGSATSGLVSFQDIPVELIERIEIVRGPRSSLYGADAIGGVIQIFTRRAAREGLHGRAHAGAGSHGYRKAGAGLTGGNARAWFGLDAHHERTDGINACRGIGAPVFAGCFTTEPDRDGYRSRSLSARGGVKLGGTWQLEAHALRAEGENEYDGSFVNYSETVQQVFGAKAVWTPNERTRLQFLAGRNDDESDNFHDGVDRGDFATGRTRATVQGDFTLASGHLLTAGLDGQREQVDSSTVYVRRERDNAAAFVQYQGEFGAHALQASLRHDDNEQFGGATTGNLAWGLSFGRGWRAHASYGTAFKAPTFNELYYPFASNPELDPERSRSAELGVAWRGERASVRLDAFETRVRDLIAFDIVSFMPANVDRARLRGLELGGDARWSDWSVQGSLSLLDPENRSAAAAGRDLPRRARRSARIELDRAFGRLSLGLTGVAEGERYDDFANTRRIGGYATFDLRAEYAFANDWRVQLRLANAFDRRYETVAYYNQPGREWFVTVRYAPAR